MLFSDVVPIRSREHPPVDPADVVARHVPAMLREVDRRPEVGRTVQTVDETVDDGSGEQIEAADPRQDLGVDEAGASERGCHLSFDAELKLRATYSALHLSFDVELKLRATYART